MTTNTDAYDDRDMDEIYDFAPEEQDEEQAEPACECCYVDVDRVDASCCELHNERRAA